FCAVSFREIAIALNWLPPSPNMVKLESPISLAALGALTRTSSASHGHFPENAGETRSQIRWGNRFASAVCYQGPNTNSLLLVPTYTLPLITVGTAHFAPAPRLPLRYNSLLTSVASN